MSDLKLLVIIVLMCVAGVGVYFWLARTKVAYRPAPERKVDVPIRNRPPWDEPQPKYRFHR